MDFKDVCAVKKIVKNWKSKSNTLCDVDEIDRLTY